MSRELELLQKLSEAAGDLAGYASYSEIVGAIGHNRQAIRTSCDEVFTINHEVKEYLESLAEDNDH